MRLIVPQYGFADFMDLAIGEIWHYGSDAAQVPGRLSAMLADLSAAARPEIPSRPPAMGGQDRRFGGPPGGCGSAERIHIALRLNRLVWVAAPKASKEAARRLAARDVIAAAPVAGIDGSTGPASPFG